MARTLENYRAEWTFCKVQAAAPPIEAFLYTLLLLGTLGVILFAIFFRDPPRISS